MALALRLADMNGYVFGKKLGSGAQGSVYEIRPKGTNEIYALKVTDYVKFASSPKSFIEEFNAVTRSTYKPRCHDNVVCYYDFFRFKAKEVNQGRESVGILMEYILGHSLDVVIKEKIPIVVKNIARELIKGIAHLHRSEVVHRDIKPTNIFCNSEGCKLIDLGFSCFLSECRIGIAVGSLYYMAPEIVSQKAAREDLYKSDIWSYGIVLYYIVTEGYIPWHSKTLKGIGDEIISGSIVGIVDRMRAVGEMKELIRRCLDMDPKLRPTADGILRYLT